MICAKRSRLVVAAVMMVGAWWVGCLRAHADTLVPIYSLTDLGLMRDAVGINDSGQVAGHQGTDAVRWEAGSTVPTVLGRLGGTGSVANSINNAGQVVGYSLVAGDWHRHAVIWQGGGTTATDLGIPMGNESEAFGINASGQVVGTTWGAGYRAVQWASDGTPTVLGKTEAAAINDAGQVVGYGEFGHGALWEAGSTSPTDIGTLGGAYAYAQDINSTGQIVGYSYIPGNTREHAAWWDSGAITPTDLGTLGGTQSWAYAVNDSGWAVGWSYLSGDAAGHAALWFGSSVYDLNDLLGNTSGWVLGQANDINNAGQIVGTGVGPDGQTHAFLLTPQNQDPEQVPEPSSLALLASTLLPAAGLLCRRRTARAVDSSP